MPPNPDPNGTTTGYSYGYTQTYTLPFRADYVLWVEDGETWGLKEWSAGESAWVTFRIEPHTNPVLKPKMQI